MHDRPSTGFDHFSSVHLVQTVQGGGGNPVRAWLNVHSLGKCPGVVFGPEVDGHPGGDGVGDPQRPTRSLIAVQVAAGGRVAKRPQPLLDRRQLRQRADTQYTPNRRSPWWTSRIGDGVTGAVGGEGAGSRWGGAALGVAGARVLAGGGCGLLGSALTVVSPRWQPASAAATARQASARRRDRRVTVVSFEEPSRVNARRRRRRGAGMGWLVAVSSRMGADIWGSPWWLRRGCGATAQVEPAGHEAAPRPVRGLSELSLFGHDDRVTMPWSATPAAGPDGGCPTHPRGMPGSLPSPRWRSSPSGRRPAAVRPSTIFRSSLVVAAQTRLL
jgi:hypothetical protein